MKILQVVHFFLPRHSAGTEVYTDRLARTLLERHDVAVLFAEKTLAQENYRHFIRDQHGLRCHVLINNLLYGGFRETFENLEVERRVDEILRLEKPDLVHVQHLMNLSLGVVSLVKRRGIKAVMTLHDFWLFCARMGQLLEHGTELCTGPGADKCSRCLQSFKFAQSPSQARMIRMLAWTQKRLGVSLDPWLDKARGKLRLPLGVAGKRTVRGRAFLEDRHDPQPEILEERARQVARLISQVDLFVAPSRTMMERSIEFGIPSEKIRLLPNGCLVSGDARTPVHRRRSHVEFGFLGTPAPHKGLHVLIEAFRRLNSDRARLKVFGGPSRSQMRYYHSLRKEAAGLPIEFLGPVPNHRIAEVFHSIDVLVVPSTWVENSPVVIQEARWFKVPVIASRLGGMQEAVEDGVDGLLFEPGDPSDLATRIDELCKHPRRVDDFAGACSPPMTMAEHAGTLERWYAEQLQ